MSEPNYEMLPGSDLALLLIASQLHDLADRIGQEVQRHSEGHSDHALSECDVALNVCGMWMVQAGGSLTISGYNALTAADDLLNEHDDQEGDR